MIQVRPQEEAFDFSSISKELSEFDDVIKSSGDHGSTHRAYQLLTPVSLTHSKRVLQCSVIPDQIITLFVVDDQTGYFSVQDRIKFTHENIGNIHPRLHSFLVGASLTKIVLQKFYKILWCQIEPFRLAN